MKLDINVRNLSRNEAMLNHIHHRFSFAFSRISNHIESAAITVADINGPKGGVDKQCKLSIKPVGLNPIVVTEKRDNVRQAVDRCFARASQAINRKLKRKQGLMKKTDDLTQSMTEAQPTL